MANELFLISTQSGLTVKADLYQAGAFLDTITLTSTSGAPGSTIYKGDMPFYPAGKYLSVYRVDGQSEFKSSSVLWWTGSAELDLNSLLTSVNSIKGSGFSSTTDTLKAIRAAISSIPGGGGGGSTGELSTIDKATLARIEAFAKDASAASVGDFITNQATNQGILLYRDGGVAATFSLRDISGQGSISAAVQRQRL